MYSIQEIRAKYAELLGVFEYGDTATAAILKNFDKLTGHSQLSDKLCAHYESYSNGTLDMGVLNSDVEYSAEVSGMSVYECRLVLYTSLLSLSRAYYDNAGLSKTVWYDSILDFKWKMEECLDIHGVYGIFTTWMDKWFFAKRAAFGRLEFDLNVAKADYVSGDVSVKAGDPVVAVHIPSRSRYEFTRESCKESYRMAYEYFKSIIGTPMIFGCCSWMVWEENQRLLPESSRVRAFAADYDIVASYDGSDHLWRIYGRADCSDIASLPERTGLQRIYKSYLLEHGKIGSSQGYFCYEHRFGSTNL